MHTFEKWPEKWWQKPLVKFNDKPLPAELAVLSLEIRSDEVGVWINSRGTKSGATDLVQWDDHFRKQVVTRLDSLIFGLLGAWLHYYHGNFWFRQRNPTFLIGLLLLIVYKASFVLQMLNNWDFNLYYCVFSFTLVSLAIFLLLPLLSHLRSGSGFWYRTLTLFSLVSYSMYLLHFNVVQHIAIPHIISLLPLELEGNTLALFKFSLYWLINIVGSILLYKFFELPTTGLRNRLAIGRLKVSVPT